MLHEVVSREREAILVVSKRLPVRRSEIGAVFGQAFGEVYGSLEARGVGTAGPPFVIYHESPVGDDPFEIEICAPVVRPTDPPEGWRMQELPAGSFVSLVHVGPYDTLGTAYDALTAWIGEHALVAAGPPREVYLSGPETPATEIRTVIEFPVVTRPAEAIAT